jgi:hypothetical protein
MTQPTAADIFRLCDQWCSASLTSSGGMTIGGNTARCRLLPNGVVFHELNHDGLCAAIVGLSKVLLRPGLNTVVHHDHFALWSWYGELLLSPHANLFPADQHEIKALYEATLHASLAGCRKPVSSKAEWEAQRRIDELQPQHTKQLVLKAHLVLAYLAFPLFEAVLKRACVNYVSFDGRVVAEFTVRTRQGSQKRYDPHAIEHAHSDFDESINLADQSPVIDEMGRVVWENEPPKR